MGNAIRKMKRDKKAVSPSPLGPLDPTVLHAYNKGYEVGHDEGSSQQKESDIEVMISILKNLESIESIGEKRAWKIREFFLKEFANG